MTQNKGVSRIIKRAEGSNVIEVDFRKRPTLEEAKEFLGDRFFKLAMDIWPMDELKRTIYHPEAFFGGVDIHYEAVYAFRMVRQEERDRLKGEQERVPCPVIQFRPRTGVKEAA